MNMSSSQEKPMITWYNRSSNPEVQMLENTMRTDEIEISQKKSARKTLSHLKSCFLFLLMMRFSLFWIIHIYKVTKYTYPCPPDQSIHFAARNKKTIFKRALNHVFEVVQDTTQSRPRPRQDAKLYSQQQNLKRPAWFFVNYLVQNIRFLQKKTENQ